MKKSLSHLLLNINPATVAASATSSGAGNVLMNRLGSFAGKKGNTGIPEVPFESEIVKVGDIDCCLHTYDPATTFSGTPPKALIVFLHGFNAHGTFPTTRIVADLMVANGYAFVAPDLPGHGRSSGLRGFVESGDKMISFAQGIISHAYRDYLEKVSLQKVRNGSSGTPGLKLFVVGSSMGGNLALHSALRSHDISGVILMAPMLRIALIKPVIRPLLKLWTNIIPMLEIIPIRKNNNYRCPRVYHEVEKDTLKPHKEGDRGRLKSVSSLLELTDSLDAQFDEVSCPCFVMVADEDTTVDNQGAADLVKRAKSNDMTLQRYPALHGLMGEPSPLLDRMQDDMVTWLNERYARDNPASSSL